MNITIDNANVKGSFKRIAKMLLNKYQLCVNESAVPLCDIEFYWNNNGKHKDESTHKHAFEEGRLRAHSSGLDITLKSDKGYGGILIRGVLIDGEGVSGPLNAAEAILKYGGNVFETSVSVKIELKQEATSFQLYETVRKGLGKNAKGFENESYRFISCAPAYLKIVQGKEALAIAMFNQEKLTGEEVHQTLGYKPKAIAHKLNKP